MSKLKGRGGAWHYSCLAQGVQGSLGILRSSLAVNGSRTIGHFYLMARCGDGATVTFSLGRLCAASPQAHWDVVFP